MKKHWLATTANSLVIAGGVAALVNYQNATPDLITPDNRGDFSVIEPEIFQRDITKGAETFVPSEPMYILSPSANHEIELPESIYESSYFQTRVIQTDDGFVNVPPVLQNVFITCGVLSGIPPEILAQKSFAESSFRTDAFHSDTNARGLMQFLPETALEILYDMGQDEQYAAIFPETQLVTRHLDEEQHFIFGVIAGVDQNALLKDVLENPFSSTCMAAEYNRKYLSVFQKDYPDLELTSLHSYLLHWQGLNGTRALVNAYIDDPNQDAADVVAGGAEGQIVQNHKSIFYDDEENPRSISEMFTYLAEGRGIGDTPLSLTHPETNFKITYSGPDSATLTEEWAQIIRPMPRPSDLGGTENSVTIETSLRPKSRPIELAQN